MNSRIFDRDNFTEISDPGLFLSDAVCFCSENGSILQSLDEAISLRIAGLDNAGNNQITRTTALYFKENGVWYVAVDDTPEEGKNITIKYSQEYQDAMKAHQDEINQRNRPLMSECDELTHESLYGMIAEHAEYADEVKALKEEFRLDIEAQTPSGKEISELYEAVQNDGQRLESLEILLDAGNAKIVLGGSKKQHETYDAPLEPLKARDPLVLPSNNYLVRDAISRAQHSKRIFAVPEDFIVELSTEQNSGTSEFGQDSRIKALIPENAEQYATWWNAQGNGSYVLDFKSPIHLDGNIRENEVQITPVVLLNRKICARPFYNTGTFARGLKNK